MSVRYVLHNTLQNSLDHSAYDFPEMHAYHHLCPDTDKMPRALALASNSTTALTVVLVGPESVYFVLFSFYYVRPSIKSSLWY